MTGMNTQIEAYLNTREVKAHDLELLKMIKEDFPSFSGKVLDIGCASGSFIKLMSENYPEAEYTGFDISQELIDIAAKKLRRTVKANLEVSDVLDFTPKTEFDIIVASGVLSIFDDFSVPLKMWLRWLRKSGKLYIFGRFNSKNIDTIIHFKNNVSKSSTWEGGLTSYSIYTIRSFLEQQGYNARFTRFNLSLDLFEDVENPIRTFTMMTTCGKKIVVNGANIIAEHFFLEIKSAQS
jgi:trans-aconitate 2-methyltransferase